MSLELWTVRTAERTEEGKRETAMIGGQPGFRHSAAHFHSDLSFQLDLFSHIFPNLTATLFFHWVRFLLGSVLLLLTKPHFHLCSYSNDFNWFTKNEIINCSIPPPERRVAVRRRRGSIRRELGDNGKDNKERWEGGGCGYILMEGLGAEGKRVGRVNFLMLTSSCPSSFQHHL